MKKEKISKEKPENVKNPMHSFHIEKVLLSSGATGDALLKAKKLLEMLSGSKAQIIASKKRIPDFGVRPGLEVGTKVTLRGEKAISLLRRLLGAIDNKLSKKQVSDNHFSFGIKEYIEIPGTEYQREIGIRGLNITVVFARLGIRVKVKKIKRGTIPKRQNVSKLEIINFMQETFKTEFK
nr:50S ribosomal protein L5P [uncultured archaeon]